MPHTDSPDAGHSGAERQGTGTARADLARQVLESRFAITKFRQGYRIDDVDMFLDELVAGLQSGSPTDELLAQISQAKFAATRWRSGYDCDIVDNFLDQIADSLKTLGTA